MSRIMLIEDDPDVTETIVSILQALFPEVAVEHIADGWQFKRGRWRTAPWALVVLDLMMPGATGFEVCEQLRSHPETRHVPILALTGYDTLQNEARILAAGANAYLAKPFELPQFIAAVKRLMPHG